MVIKLKKTSKQKAFNYIPEKGKRIKLSFLEIGELIVDILFSSMILLFLNLIIILPLNLILKSENEFTWLIFSFKMLLVRKFSNAMFYSMLKFFIIFLLVIDVLVLIWRIRKRYSFFQINHVLDELNYISKGNYNHRISFEFRGKLGIIVDSINKMVMNTAQSIKKEKELKRYKDDLISNVSHDFRTPLTSVLGYLSLIEEGKYSSEEELLLYSHTAYLKTKQLESLVEGLFEYTKIQQPSTKFYFQKINLTTMLNQFSIDFLPIADKKGIVIESYTIPEVLWMVADPDKLARVFNNLIDNAFKYGVGATKIQLLAEDMGSKIVVIVKNNGEMIPQKALKCLFERFFQSDKSQTLVNNGLGLGLAIVQAIVKNHEGEIQAISNHEWTSFVMYFPKKI